MNLLPPQQQREFQTRYRVRLAAVSSLALALLAAIALVLLVPAYIVASNKESFAQAQLAQAQRGGEGTTTPVQDLKEVTKNIHEKLSVLAPAHPALPQASSVIEEFLARRSGGISITALFFDTGASGEVLSVRGVAHDRQTLADFAGAVKQDALFRSVELPAGSFVQKSDIDFVVTVRIASTTSQTGKGST
ncbi:MAG: hypothetical protein ACYC8S_03140 [Minisyncoccota bacterium]